MQTPKDAWSTCAWHFSFCHKGEWGTNRDGAPCSERVQIETGNFRKGFLEEELVGKIQRRAQVEQGKPVLCPLHSSDSLMSFNHAYPPLAGDSSIFFRGGGGGEGAECWLWTSIFL